MLKLYNGTKRHVGDLRDAINKARSVPLFKPGAMEDSQEAFIELRKWFPDDISMVTKKTTSTCLLCRVPAPVLREKTTFPIFEEDVTKTQDFWIEMADVVQKKCSNKDCTSGDLQDHSRTFEYIPEKNAEMLCFGLSKGANQREMPCILAR